MKIFQIPLFEAMSEAELADMQALHCMRTKVFEKMPSSSTPATGSGT